MQPNINTSSLKNFAVLEKLGEGSFASVYKVQRIDDKKLYAMKKVKIAQMKQKQRDNALNQVRVLASISHQNIVNYKEAFFDDTTQSLCIVMELADAGDIQKKINHHIKNHSYFTEAEIWQALIQMSRGLKALHQINILHRDLKCANVFCTKDNKYKLGDLNVSKVAKRGMARTQTGTPYYTSPEVWKDRPYDSKCDIWSLGCVIYEMAALHPPFRANNLKELYTKIQRGIFQRIPTFYSEDLCEIINLCLKVNPTSRPNAVAILQNAKVVKNMPSSERYSHQEVQGKKANLINTILCPRNLKSLKMALPGANYQSSPKKQVFPVRSKSVDMSQNPQRRPISSKAMEKPVEIPRVITSPKAGQIGANEVKYAIMRRPSSDRHILPNIYKRQQSSDVRPRQNSRPQSRQNSRMSRNNSADYIRRRQYSNVSIDSKQKNRQDSNVSIEAETKKRPQSNHSIESQNRMKRNLSNKSLEGSQKNKNNISNRSIESSSRQKRQQSAEKIAGAKAFMEDISNKVKNIQQRVRMVRMARMREEPRPQKPSDSYQKKYNMPVSSREKRDNSIKSRQMSRNNSIQIKPSNIPVSRPISRGKVERSLSRNRSIERIQRQNSRKAILPNYMYQRLK